MSPGRVVPWWVAAMLAIVLIALGAEAFSRWALGLGTPPLYEADAGFEYRLRPDQDLYRFGNHIVVNRWGMRSKDFGETKTHTSELRVMVFGDSVVNGGSEVSHDSLATSLLQQTLHSSFARNVTVGNVSAGSWGPGNWLAYAMRFGFFNADLVILVVGSGDARDNPDFAPLGINHPTQNPSLAVQEAVMRYLPRYLPEPLAKLIKGVPTPPPANPSNKDSAAQDPSLRGLDDLRRFLLLARSEGRKVAVLHHPDREETATGQWQPGYHEIAAVVKELDLPWIGLRETYRETTEPIYRDSTHLSLAGQRALAKALQDVATRLLAGDAYVFITETAPQELLS